MDIYNTPRWKKKRLHILKRDKFMCQESKRYGKRVDATTVHHIYSYEDYPELAFEDWNLLSLSSDKHNAMHSRETHEMTELGIKWQERLKDSFINYYKDKEVINPNAVQRLKEYGVIK